MVGGPDGGFNTFDTLMFKGTLGRSSLQAEPTLNGNFDSLNGRRN